MSHYCVHVAYHDDNCDDLLLTAVRPVLAGVAGSYFVRHWQRGPHLRLNVPMERYAGRSTDQGTVERLVAEHVGGYLAGHPSTAELDPAALLPLHQSLARMEQVDGPLLPWYPNNSVQPADYDDRAAALGGRAAADLLAGFYVATTPALFDALAQVRAGAARLGAALDLIISVAHAFADGGITGGFVSLRSHAEAFLGEGDRSRLRRAWDEQYRLRACALQDRVSAIVAEVDRGTNSWVQTVRPTAQAGQRLLAAGRLPMSSLRQARGSEFHQALAGNDRWHEQVEPSLAFRSYRLLLNYTYLQLTRLGVKPVERFMLCHFAANAVEERYGVSAIDLVQS
ncbi:MAG: thiopeptide maturation pyridine synthase [Pseudonocardiaceae bacterium]